MATSAQFSFAELAKYGNKRANTQGDSFRSATISFVENTLNAVGKQYGYPTTKEEVHDVLNKFEDYDVSPLTDQVPALVSDFMHDEKRSFELPAPDDNTCPAIIKVVAKDEDVKEGTVQFGACKGEHYKTTVAAHEEVVVKNNRNKFKK